MKKAKERRGNKKQWKKWRKGRIKRAKEMKRQKENKKIEKGRNEINRGPTDQVKTKPIKLKEEIKLVENGNYM